MENSLVMIGLGYVGLPLATKFRKKSKVSFCADRSDDVRHSKVCIENARNFKGYNP